jgi:hypothetical protein
MDGSCHCGKVKWTYDGVPQSASSCDCSVCRRYGALWGYDFEDEKLHVSGDTSVYLWNRKWLGFHFCPQCACVVYWRAVMARDDGRRHMGFNLRLASDAAAVQAIPLIHHSTELKDDLPSDGKHVSDVWA